MNHNKFRKQLLAWYDASKRDLPWRDVDDPYLIWLSEIMLQQTQVNTVKSYFKRFIRQFPTIEDLANASQEQVMMLWEGLGYYSRARNMHETARNIAENYNGEIPDSRDEIIRLKGVGPYTAAAV